MHAQGGKTCPCPSTAVIGKGIGWELGWLAHKRAYTRLISLHRWLGQASHIEQTTLFGESYDYDCIRNGGVGAKQQWRHRLSPVCTNI